jgi:hypothetical protein
MTSNQANWTQDEREAAALVRVHELAAAEGLELVPSDGQSGFKKVYKDGRNALPMYDVKITMSPGDTRRIGKTFKTAAEAALAYARYIGPAQSAKEAAHAREVLRQRATHGGRTKGRPSQGPSSQLEPPTTPSYLRAIDYTSDHNASTPQTTAVHTVESTIDDDSGGEVQEVVASVACLEGSDFKPPPPLIVAEPPKVLEPAATSSAPPAEMTRTRKRSRRTDEYEVTVCREAGTITLPLPAEAVRCREMTVKISYEVE